MAHYKDSKYNNTVLWKYIREDFIKQIKEIWALIKKNIIQDFHNFLWENGVFIFKNRDIIKDNIQEQVLDTEKEHKWTL